MKVIPFLLFHFLRPALPPLSKSPFRLICADASRLQSCSVSSAAVQHNLQSPPPAAAGARSPAVRPPAQPHTAGRPTPQRRMKNTFARPLSWTCNPVPATLATAIVPRRRQKPVRRQFKAALRGKLCTEAGCGTAARAAKTRDKPPSPAVRILLLPRSLNRKYAPGGTI